MKSNINYLKNLFKYLLFFVSVFIVIGIIKFYLIMPVFIKGESMSPTLKDGEFLFELKKLTLGTIKREDIVSIEYENKIISKRVIGLPGEVLEVSNGNVYINNELVLLSQIEYPDDLNIVSKIVEPDSYYVLGDNIEKSLDSREIGTIKNNLIVGKLLK